MMKPPGFSPDQLVLILAIALSVGALAAFRYFMVY
jgi:hypothetical protein